MTRRDRIDLAEQIEGLETRALVYYEAATTIEALRQPGTRWGEVRDALRQYHATMRALERLQAAFYGEAAR